MSKRRVVITGIGAVTPLGNSVPETWASVKAGKCGIKEITHYDTSAQKVKLAAQVADGTIENYYDARDRRKTDRCTLLGMMAADEAVKDSGANFEDMDTDRCAVIFSSGIGGLGTIASEHARGMEKGFDRVSPFFIPASIANMSAGQIAIRFGLHGMCTCPVTACASGTNAIGDAFHHIRDGYADLALCGGTEASITAFGIGGFTSLHALNSSTDPKRASIPFDAERSGFVMGEGAGVLVIEEYEQAKKRGAKIYAEIIGYGANCDAHHITAPLETGAGAAACMKKALNDAGISAESIDYINAHGTSTPLGDAGETKAVRTAFGEHADVLKVSSTKSMTGHLLGASGAIEAIICAKAVDDGFIPATLNLQVPDPKCDLNYVPNIGIEQNLSHVMSNSLGFGGHNASLILRKMED